MNIPKLEKNIPIPPRRKPRQKIKWSQLLSEMEIGDSFTHNKTDCIRATAVELHISLTIRKIGKESWRIWRIA